MSRLSSVNRSAGLVAAALFAVTSVHGQWVTSRIELHQGWNAVMLQVAPATADIAVQFASLPVDSVWSFAPSFNTIEFTENPLEPLADSPHWQIWYRPGTSQLPNTLANIRGGEAYIIKASADCTWNVTGRPVIPRISWYPGYMNLVGFPVNPVTPPTFKRYFEACDEIDASGVTVGDCPIYKIVPMGSGYAIQQVRTPAIRSMTPDEAYWVKLDRATSFTAPVEVKAPSADGLVFGTDIQDLSLRIFNRGKITTTISIRQLCSDLSPAGYPEFAGEVPLSYFITDPGASMWTWSTNFPSVLTRELAPDESWQLQLGVRRKELSLQYPLGTDGIAYQSLLEVTDSQGLTRSLVPVSAEYAETPVSDAPYNLYGGLWVGEVSITQSGRINADGTSQLESTASAFSQRLILHNGWVLEGTQVVSRCQMLPRVIAGQAPVLSTNDTAHISIWTAENEVPADAEDLIRISSVTTPPDGMLLAGDFASALQGSNVLSCASSVNPFVHLYHPNHDNRDAEGVLLAEGIESFDITRVITLTFDTNAMAQSTSPHMGTDYVIGTYQESVTGLRKEPIEAAGKFYLKKLLSEERLNW